MKKIKVTMKYVAFTKKIGKDIVIDHKTKSLCRGTHTLQDQFDFIESDDVADFDSWVVYKEPVSQDEVNESLIAIKTRDIIRAQAITALKAEGKLPHNFKDKKINVLV